MAQIYSSGLFKRLGYYPHINNSYSSYSACKLVAPCCVYAISYILRLRTSRRFSSSDGLRHTPPHSDWPIGRTCCHSSSWCRVPDRDNFGQWAPFCRSLPARLGRWWVVTEVVSRYRCQRQRIGERLWPKQYGPLKRSRRKTLKGQVRPAALSWPSTSALSTRVLSSARLFIS